MGGKVLFLGLSDGYSGVCLIVTHEATHLLLGLCICYFTNKSLKQLQALPL